MGALLIAAVAAGCGDSGTSTTDNASTGGNTAPAAGGPAVGAAGATSAAGGSAAPAAGAEAPAAGAAAPAAGAAAPEASGDFACGAPSTKAPAELSTAAAGVLLPAAEGMNGSCAFGSCHNASKKVAGLELSFGTSISELVGKPSCQAPNLKLVEPGGGDEALAKSWLYLKLAAPVDGSSALIPDPAWGMANNTCGQTTGDFGVRMPFSGGADGIGAAKLGIIREWICAGAPGM